MALSMLRRAAPRLKDVSLSKGDSMQTLGHGVQDAPPLSPGDTLPVVFGNVAPPVHLFGLGITHESQYFLFLMDFNRVYNFHKLDWKPRLLATTWVHGLSPHDWAPKMLKLDKSMAWAELTRYWLTFESLFMYLYTVFYLIIIGGTMWHFVAACPDMNNINIGWSIYRSYLTRERIDFWEYNWENSPAVQRGGGKFLVGRFRWFDAYSKDCHLMGLAKNKAYLYGPYETWSMNDPYNNPYARATARA